MALTRKRVMVTGGAGFLGSHLCERLLREGHDVLCVDNYFTGRKDNIVHLLDDKHFEVMRHDITFPLYVEVDEIFNLACPASPVHYQFDPVQTTKTSVIGAINMLGLAKRVGAKILQAIEEALYRMEKGTYGICRDCGEPIAPARLNAIPWTRVCITCKEKQSS